MTREQQVKVNFSAAWVLRTLLTGLVAAVLYFVTDIHRDFKTYIAKTNELEQRVSVMEAHLDFKQKKK